MRLIVEQILVPDALSGHNRKCDAPSERFAIPGQFKPAFERLVRLGMVNQLM